ncbi:division/cell wall cluster transcriptional repressor MraZ [Pseudorhodobacter sp. E13]|uniref:division/cell wall cluster transcriptional repressor MraZ n=1 Tax=Pseudorhodobacter sp. E13 TaxID=2487931 RepID=UPI000F8D1BC9|nr:division/cell wall cluster transcriptional repressor MraZ [Pseudorhodobacter sp. E13]RUS59936.1 division/cell wall cluster transcriptional repressor MraZ [Pseudorhodobacter sp. E13]
MSEDFRGEYYQKVDSKARVSIPAAFRRVLDAGDPSSSDTSRTRIMMVYGGKSRQYAECYTIRDADALAAQVRALPIGSKQRQIAERDLITRSLTVEIDENGRIVLPQKVRDKIGFEDGDETAFAGTLDRFQIWKRDTYDAVNGSLDDEEDELPDGVDVLSLLSRVSPGV